MTRDPMQEIEEAIEDGYAATDVRSDPGGIDVHLRRGDRVRTVHLSRQDAREVLSEDEAEDEPKPWIL